MRHVRRNLIAAGFVGFAASLALPVMAHTETTIVTMTSEGFTPREVTVDTGAVVRFVNADTTAHWPASDPHPLHDRYAELDPTRAIAPGDSWFFRPKRPGTWAYHDHLSPHRRGVLRVIAEAQEKTDETALATVAPASSPTSEPPRLTGWPSRFRHFLARIGEALRRPFTRRALPSPSSLPKPAAFRDLPEREQYEAVRTLSHTKGLPAALTYIKETYTNNTGASLGGRAHDLMHFLGGLIFQERALQGLSLCDATFAFGCYHGFTEAALAGSIDRLGELARACGTLGAEGSGPWASCIHGTGHGVATHYASTDLTSALGACDTLGVGASYCHDGVFMEFSFTAPPSFYRSEDPLFPCTAIPAQYQQACARNQPKVLQHRFGFSRRSIADACTREPASIADPCIDALGFAAANESQGSTEYVVRACRELPTTLLVAQCVSAAAGEFVFQNFPNWQGAASSMCNSLSPEFQQACESRVRKTAANYQR